MTESRGLSVRKTVCLLAVTALAVTGLVAGPASADSSRTPTEFRYIRAMVVDEADARVFVTGTGSDDSDWALDHVLVLDLEGRPVGTIEGLTDAVGLALNASHSKLYVSLHADQQIAVIDTATLTEIKRIDVAACPAGLALNSGVLVVQSVCESEEGVYAVDLADESLTAISSFSTWQMEAAGGRLLTYGNGGLGVYDLTNPAYPLLASRWLTGYWPGVTLTPDGQTVLAGSFRRIIQAPADTLETSLVYHTKSTGAMKAVEVGGKQYFIRSRSQGRPPGIDIFELGQQDPVASAVVSEPGMIRATSDLSRVFVGSASNGVRRSVSVVYDLLADNSTISAKAERSPVRLGQRISMSGRLSLSNGASPRGSLVEVRRDNSDGYEVVGTVEAGRNGTFTYDEPSTALGTNRYEFVYVGVDGANSAVDSVEVRVNRKVPPLSLKVADTRLLPGQTAKVTVSLGQGPTNRKVRLYVRPEGKKSRVFDSVTLQPGETKTFRYPVEVNTLFTADFDGDAMYASDRVGREVGVEVRIHQTMRRWDDRRNGAYIYNVADEPLLQVKVDPRKPGRCMEYHFQAKRASGWKWLAYVECYKLTRRSTGGVIYNLKGERRTGTLYRVRSAYPGDRYHVATAGDWEYFRFTR